MGILDSNQALQGAAGDTAPGKSVLDAVSALDAIGGVQPSGEGVIDVETGLVGLAQSGVGEPGDITLGVEMAGAAQAGPNAEADLTVSVPVLPYMVLGLHMDGSSFTDVKEAIPEVVSPAQISADQSKFGGASGHFPGPADNNNSSFNGLNGRPLIRFPDISGYQFASDISRDFTISLWIFLNDTGKQQSILSNAYFGNIGSGNGGIMLYVLSNNKIRFEIIGDSSSNIYCSIDGITAMSASEWYHVAITGAYDGVKRVTRLFLNGVFDAAAPAHQIVNGAVSGEMLYIGCGRLSNALNYLSYPANVYIDDLYILNGPAGSGACQWTSGFTPPSHPFFDG
jgi:hypothetical protein